MSPFETIVQALSKIRAPVSTKEYDLHALTAKALEDAGIPYRHEVMVAPRCRLDFLAQGIGIEIKRSRPNLSQLTGQVTRYLASPMVAGLLVLCERDPGLPESLLGKPCKVVSLQRLWGIALSSGNKGQPRQPQPIQPRQTAESPAYKKAEIETSGSTAYPDENLDSNFALPAYLLPGQAVGRVYGTLSYQPRSKTWVINGDPAVTEVAKRLFPGAHSGKRGIARFAAHRRLIGELNWFMQRYPLAVLPRDQDRWQAALIEAQQHFKKQEQFRLAAPPYTDVTGAFTGKLRPFQQYGASWLTHTSRALLADEMGLGKTVQTLAALAATRGFPAIIVVPPHLLSNWAHEIKRFLSFEGKEPTIHVISGLKPYHLPPADIYLVHYLLLRGWKQALPELGFNTVVFDEIQELRHRGTEKYSAASLLANACEKVFGLSGTPIYNHGGEIWNVVNILDYHLLGDWEAFSREWCYGYGNSVVLHPDWLGDHLRREGLMLRRTKKEVLPELPDKRRLVQQVDADDALFSKLMAPVVEQLQELSKSQELGASQRAMLENQLSMKERQATGIVKAPYVAQFVRALLENGEKVLVFAHHHKVMDILQTELKRHSPAFITGRETALQKDQSVARFTSGKTDLCCISLRAAAGLNLQQATCVVFAELDWSPAVHSQAEDRAHRIGQTDSLLCYYLVSSSGADSVIQDALGLKVSQFLGLMGETPDTAEEAGRSAQLAKAHVADMMQRWLGR